MLLIFIVKIYFLKNIIKYTFSIYHNEPQELSSKKDLTNKVAFSTQGCSLGDRPIRSP